MIPIRPLLIAASFLLARSVSAEEKWQEAASDNFVLVTNASGAQAETILETLERFRFVLGQVLPEMRRHSPVPTRVYGFRDSDSFEPFLPLEEWKGPRIAGYFRSSRASNAIVVDLASGAAAVERVLFHEYVHLVLSLRSRELPSWFEEGLAEFYAGARLGRDSAEVGVFDPRHRSLLSRKPLLPLEELLRARADEDLDPLFYAQSWALVHYLLTGAPRGPERLARFLALHREGADPVFVFREAFGVDLSEMEAELRDYVRRGRWPGVRVELTMMPAPTVTSRRLERAEVLQRWGELFFATGKLREARICIEGSVEADPGLGSAREALGLLNLAEGDRKGAETELARAIVLGSASPSALTEYARLLLEPYSSGKVETIPDTVAAPAASALRESLSRAPGARGPSELLAFVYVVRGERLGEAEALLRTALAIAPESASLRFLEAQLLAKQGHYERAGTILERLIEESGDREMQQRVKEFLARVNEVQRAPGR